MFDIDDDADFAEACARDAEILELDVDVAQATGAFAEIVRIQELERLKARIEAAQIREIAAFTARCVARAQAEALVRTEDRAAGEFVPPEKAYCTGLEQASAEIALALAISGPAGSNRVNAAVELTDRFPTVVTALAEGRITITKVRILVEQTAQLCDGMAAEVTARVLGIAKSKTPSQFKYAVRRAVVDLDAEALKRRQQAAATDRGVWLRELPDGMAEISAILPGPEAVGAMAVLDHFATETKTDTPADGRTTANRRADALLDLILGPIGHAATGSTATDSPRGPLWRRNIRVDVRVTVPFSALFGIDEQPSDLTGYGPITADQARQLAAHGTWRRILTDPPTGNPVDFGTTKYRPPANLRDAVITKHPTCSRPGCTMPAATCELDHHEPHRRSKTTTYAGISPYCKRDHRMKQTPGWTIEYRSDGSATWTTPSGHTYDYTPQPIAEPPPSHDTHDWGDPPF